MSKRRAYIITGAVAFILIFVWGINFFVYPFRADNPNFSDVERVFNRIQIPSDWQLIEQTENRGRFGRTCPVESETRCFSKGAIYKVDSDTTINEIETVYKSSGCESISKDTVNYTDRNRTATNLRCSTPDGLLVDGTYAVENNEGTVSVYVSTE